MLTDAILMLIKYVVLPGYEPNEDVLALSLGISTSLVKIWLQNYRNSVNTQLKKNFTKKQIAAVNEILAQSDDRFIINSPSSIYDHNADSINIARIIFNAYKKRANSTSLETLNHGSSNKKLNLENEEENEQIIKGICIIINGAINLCLTSPAYIRTLTQKAKKTDTITNQNTRRIIAVDKRVSSHDSSEKKQIEDEIKAYQEYVSSLFTSRINGNTLLGEESLSETYINPYYYTSLTETDSVENLIEKFLAQHNRVLYIVGEPGHGKTSMCIKAVYDFVTKKKYQSTNGVYWFSLNPKGISSIIENDSLKLLKVFSWEDMIGYRDHIIAPKDIMGSLVFLDGFDELVLSLSKCGNNDFFIQVNQIAEKYDLHIVVTSRTRAIEQAAPKTNGELKPGAACIKYTDSNSVEYNNDVKFLAPLEPEVQIAWINKLIECRKNGTTSTAELEKYKATFPRLQNNKNISGLLGLPILLRLIVHNCFTPSSGNRIKLYLDLFKATLHRQGLDKYKDTLLKEYQDLAYSIFVYNDTYVEIQSDESTKIEGKDAYLYQYYLHTPNQKTNSNKNDVIYTEFLHRSFYQFFLSIFIYEKLCTARESRDGTLILKCLWARNLDPFVLENIQLLSNAENQESICTTIIDALDETDGIILDHECPVGLHLEDDLGNYDKANNIFWNGLSIINYLYGGEHSEVIQLSPRITALLSRYDCRNIYLSNCDLSKAMLRTARLSDAHLFRSDLTGADLTSADIVCAVLSSANLTDADLSFANLSGADMNSVNLTHADLSDAHLFLSRLPNADLTRADLAHADLTGAQLPGADLFLANLEGANLTNADLTRTNLTRANLTNAVLTSVDLAGADLTGAILDGTILFGANVSNAIITKKQYPYLYAQKAINLHTVIII